MEKTRNDGTPRVLILGGGSVGLTAAEHLRRKLGSKVEITIVDSRPYLTYYPFLPEVGAGTIEPRNALAPLHKALTGVKVITGAVTRISHTNRTVAVQTEGDSSFDLTYDYLVIGLGSIPRTLPIPGLAEQAIGFKWVEEAVAVRDRVLGGLAEAASTTDPQARKRLLTFTFIGGGFAGSEAIAEAQDMAMDALKSYPELKPSDVRFVMIEAMERILPEVGPKLGEYALQQMRSRGIEVKLGTTLESCEGGHIRTSDGDEFESDLVVWTAGIKPNPILSESDLPLNQTGRLDCLPDLRVKGTEGPLDDVFAGGDCTTVPDLAAGEGKVCMPNAQNATRQGKRIAANIVASIAHEPLKNYYHRNLGTMATLGQHKGVGTLFVAGRTIELKGLPSWVAARAYHVYAMPTLPKKAAVVGGWVSQAVGRRDILGIPELRRPRQAFEKAVAGAKRN